MSVLDGPLGKCSEREPNGIVWHYADGILVLAPDASKVLSALDIAWTASLELVFESA